MLDVFYYSIAGKKSNQVISSVLVELESAEYTPREDKRIIKYTLEVAEKGQYPSKQYYSTFYEQPQYTYSKLAEILNYVEKLKDFYRSQWIKSKVLKGINESDSTQDLIQKVSEAIATNTIDVDDLDKFKPTLYSEQVKKPFNEGLKTGISEIDDLTNGFQAGSVGSICAYTGEGKSTAWVSILFKNAYAGKKCVLFSLEMTPEIVWLEMQARYLYEVKGVQITSQDLIFHKLTDENQRIIEKYDNDFKKEVVENLLIVDESLLSKQIVQDYRQIAFLFQKFQKVLGGLDMVVWDHVGQIELMFPDLGNIAIRAITSATKTWVNNKGTHIFSGLAVQCNREGRKRAAKRDGQYDLQAISELNEVEKSSTYVVFLFTTEDSKILQETKVCMQKHRLGQVLSEPTTISFNPAVCMVGSNIENISADSEFDSSFFGDGDFDDVGF